VRDVVLLWWMMLVVVVLVVIVRCCDCWCVFNDRLFKKILEEKYNYFGGEYIDG